MDTASTRRAELPLRALLDANDVAQRLSVTPGWVRRHATELGAIRLGDGPRPRLRFRPERIEHAMNEGIGDAAAAPTRAGPRRRSRSHETNLLPIRCA